MHNPAFILILRSLKLDEQSDMNKCAKVAVQSTTTEQGQQRQRKLNNKFHNHTFFFLNKKQLI